MSPGLTVLCFRREGSPDPYFVVREFDTKVIRSPSQHKKGRGPSEQAIRASIRQAILNMSLKSERATKLEIRQLKAQGILGKRAPSCSLLCADDMLRLLEAFGKHSHARELRVALKKENNFSPLPMRVEEVRPRKRRSRASAQSTKRPRVNKDTARLDALLCALQAIKNDTLPDFKQLPQIEVKKVKAETSSITKLTQPVESKLDREAESSDSSVSEETYQKTPEDITHVDSPVNLEQALQERQDSKSSFSYDSYLPVKLPVVSKSTFAAQQPVVQPSASVLSYRI